MSRRCCVPSCKKTGNVMHNFPNPRKEIERFKTWVLFIGGEILGLDDEYIYKNRRICRSHFEEKYFRPNKRITKNSIPRLNLSAGNPQKQRLHETSNIAVNTAPPDTKSVEKFTNETTDISFEEVYTLKLESYSNDNASVKDKSPSVLRVPISDDSISRTSFEEESLNDNSVRNENYTKEKTLNDLPMKPTEELLDKHPLKSINERINKHCQFHLKKDLAMHYFNNLLKEKHDETINNSIYSILLAYEMEKIPAMRKFECYNALMATMDKYITKV